MQPQPLYQSHGVQPAFALRYSWTGWPARRPLAVDCAVLEEVRPQWEGEGMRLLEHYWSDERIQLTFSATPDISPVFLAARAKARLQHALRKVGPTFSGFSRKVSVCSVGHNCRQDVEVYIAAQVDAARFSDPAFRAILQESTVLCDGVDLSVPTESAHGRYWYNLHLVLVTAERFRIAKRARLARLRDCSFQIAARKGYRISRLSVMPDHLHASLGGNIEHSPREIAMTFQNNLAYMMGQVRIWADTFYVGTFGEYDMWAIRGNQSPL
ncbi:MAG: transposase [Thermoguttaceae bacterium]